MSLLRTSLEDKYTMEHGRVFLTGTQALVRLSLMQKARDRDAGLNTAGYITGYRGSPLGGLDREFGRAQRLIDAADIKFHPAVNEDLAATAVWGTQQIHLAPGATHDGVFGIWYGKGPGVDRSGDALRHANLAGTSPTGGVLALAGDDPASKSSTVPSQSEYALIDAMIPILNPINVQEILRLGLLGIAMSRYAGLWVGMKCVIDNVDTTASIDVSPALGDFVLPQEFEMPPGGVHIRWPDPPLQQEARLIDFKTKAAVAFGRANNLNHITMDSQAPKLGICASGKAYLDVVQALQDLGIDETEANRLGIRLMKVSMPWPLDPETILSFADGVDEILVVEEKRPVIEAQIKDRLFNLSADLRPRVIGKTDEHTAELIPTAGELNPTIVARAIATRLARYADTARVDQHLAELNAREVSHADDVPDMKRIPYYCSGCPHNTSTKVPEGSRAAAGIGCHYMAIWMDRDTETFTQMGGEGANWLGQAPFTTTDHIFVNIGDGTYYHSGLLAIRAAISSGANVTYKILYNDAVAMTGGQTHDGPLDPAMIAQQMKAEGAARVVVVTDEPDKYPINYGFPPGTPIRHRKDLDEVQRDLRTVKGVSVLIYDQTCAAEKRRRRKRGTFPDPAKRMFINEHVCEGCGDCGVASNCVSLVPKETELGRKRQIDQSSCNKDYSCADGFCPSFVSVEGVQLKKPDAIGDVPFPALPEPSVQDVDEPYNMVVTGIGGTGVVTIGAILGMAAHMEGKGISILDVAGLAQKNGMVFSHLRSAATPSDITAVRLSSGSANLLLGCDLVTSCDPDVISRLNPKISVAVSNAHETMTPDFTRTPDLAFPDDGFKRALSAVTGGNMHLVDASNLARHLLGDTIGANMMLVGYALQKGLLPVSLTAIEQALELNGVAVDFNKQAILWGRRLAFDMEAVLRLIDSKDDKPHAFDLEDFITRRIDDLTAYQNGTYAARYKAVIARVQTAEQPFDQTRLSEAAARSLFKLMAYKDEYEVARLYTDGRFEKAVADSFQPGAKLKFHLAPPLLADRDITTGKPLKREFGGWMLPVFRFLAKMKPLRGTPFDLFGYTEERRMERQLIEDYVDLLATLCDGLTVENLDTAVQLAELPLRMRGFGHVKEANVQAAKECEADLMTLFQNPSARREAAE